MHHIVIYTWRVTDTLANEEWVAMKMIALTMILCGAAVGIGGALEFRYFGPGTPQFNAGLMAAPAGVLAVVSGLVSWRRGVSARRLLLLAGVAMLAATAGATALDVMGPPATVIGLLGGVAPLAWAWRH